MSWSISCLIGIDPTHYSQATECTIWKHQRRNCYNHEFFLSHFSKINQKRFFEFDWTFYFIPITRNDIFCKRKRHTYLAGIQHSSCFQQYIFTQPKLWQQAKIKTTFYFMHNAIIGRGNVFHFHVAENKCLIFPRAVSRLIKKY